ncbi:MAG: hypothetical protein AB4911_03890 [Oscillochloridaceae bacterium umkhey_bin13]
MGTTLGTQQIRTLNSVTIPITITQSGPALFGIVYPLTSQGNATLSLRAPNGTIYNQANLPLNSDNPNAPATYMSGTSDVGHDQAIALAKPQPGTYQLTIANPPAGYEQIAYSVNQLPTLNDVTFACDPANLDNNIWVTTNCASAPGAAMRPAADGIQIRFRAADADSPNANLYVGLVPVEGAEATPDWARAEIIQQNIPLNNLGAYLPTTQTPSGRYRVLVGINDGENQPVEVLSDLVVEVFDNEGPRRPDFLLTESAPGAVLVRWEPLGERDLAGYELGFGSENDPANFTTIRDLGSLSQDDQLDEDGLLSATIWGLEDNQTIFVSVRGYDQDGNRGPWHIALRGESWLLAPDGWPPLPGGVAYPDSTVRLMFATPMLVGTFNQRLELRDENGALVADTPTWITNAETGEVFGMRFIPAQPLTVGRSYEVLIRGGTEGVIAEDGRSMPDDYRWIFTVIERPSDPNQIAAPPEPVQGQAAPSEGGIPGQLPGDPSTSNRVFLPLVRR